MDTPPAPVDVLIIDDDRDMRSILADLLTIEGYTVQTAANGLEGIAQLANPEVPRVIVLDLMMPRLNGTDFHRIRSKYLRWSTIPTIVLTGQQTPPEASELGVAYVMRKPPDVEALLRLIRELCPRRVSVPPGTAPAAQPS